MKKKLAGVFGTMAALFAVSPVWAGVQDAATTAAADAAQPTGGLMDFLPMIGWMVLFGGLMYVLIYLPQKKKDKKAKEMMDSLQVGYKVITHSGVVGKIINIKDDVLTVESGVERTQIEYKRWAIRDVEKPIEA